MVSQVPEEMLCINPFCCPLRDCSLEHHEKRVIAGTLTVCEDYPRCYNLDCALYHPQRIAMTIHADDGCRAWACPMLHHGRRKCPRVGCGCPAIHRPTSPSPLNTLCESLLFSIAEFLDITGTMALYAASHAIHQNRRPVLFPRGIRFFRRKNSLFWEPCRLIAQRVQASYPSKKKSVRVVVEDGGYVHHRFEVLSVHEWVQRFSCDEPLPRLLRRDENGVVCDLGRRRDVRPATVEVGTRVDAMDQDGVWYEAVVTGLVGNEARIHFDGWDTRFDLWLWARSPAIAAHNTFTPARWRDRLRVGQEVAFRKERLWHHGTVVERTGDRVVASNGRSFLETTVSDERLSLPGCHIWSAAGGYDYRRAHLLDRVVRRWPVGDRAVRFTKTTERGYELLFA